MNDGAAVAPRVVHRLAQDEDYGNVLLMHATGANAAGQAARVVPGGVPLALMDAR
jgi:oxaloacetate decarboxylase beta subunit